MSLSILRFKYNNKIERSKKSPKMFVADRNFLHSIFTVKIVVKRSCEGTFGQRIHKRTQNLIICLNKTLFYCPSAINSFRILLRRTCMKEIIFVRSMSFLGHESPLGFFPKFPLPESQSPSSSYSS